MRSSARLTSTHLEVRPQGWARLWSLTPRPLVIAADQIESSEVLTSREVARLISWKLGGTAFSNQRAMGWFTVRGRRGARAWVWQTPGRAVRLFRVNHGRLHLVAVPVDWFAD